MIWSSPALKYLQLQGVIGPIVKAITAQFLAYIALQFRSSLSKTVWNRHGNITKWFSGDRGSCCFPLYLGIWAGQDGSTLSIQRHKCQGVKGVRFLPRIYKSFFLEPNVYHLIQNSLSPWKQHMCHLVILYYEFSRRQPASGIQCLWNTQLGKPFRNKEILTATPTLKVPGRCHDMWEDD